MKLWFGATDRRTGSTVTQWGNVTRGDVIAAETGTDRRRVRIAEPLSSDAPAERRNQPRKAIQIPFAVWPKKTSRTPPPIIRYANTRPTRTALWTPRCRLPERHQRSELNSLPPSSGNAGTRLNKPRRTLTNVR